MRRFLKFIRAGLLSSVLALASVASAFAVGSTAVQNTWMCAPNPAVNANASRAVGGTNSQVPSGTLYILNSQGCGLITSTDEGYFRSQGYTQTVNQFTLHWTSAALSLTTGQIGFYLPAGAIIEGIVVQETAGNAITGGLDIGITSTGADIASALAVAGNSTVSVITPLAQVFSRTAATPIYFTGHTAGNGAVIAVTLIYSYW
jgi:hypothetical protein